MVSRERKVGRQGSRAGLTADTWNHLSLDPLWTRPASTDTTGQSLGELSSAQG